MSNQYVLLTAAKNEEACIGEVIELVVRQTVVPQAWFIIDDGSTDRTAEIVTSFAAKHPFIHLYSAESRGGRNFGSQYKAILAAYEMARPLEFEFVAIQDADQSPERADYYELVLEEFRRDEKLGMVSGTVYERPRGIWELRPDNAPDSLAASVVIRRTCFDAIGGYTPLYYGGSDYLLQLDAMMAGWEIKTRPDLPILHYRPGSSAGGIWRGRFREGLEDASMGSHPLFEFFRCCRRITKSPFFFGSAVRFGGYVWWTVTRRKPLLPADKVAFLRKSQVDKIHRWMSAKAEYKA